EHDAIERIAVEDLNQAQISEVPVESRRRTLAGFLKGMGPELQRDAARIPNSRAHSLGELQMMTIARDEVTPALRDADDRASALQLASGEAEVEVPLEIESGHLGIVRVVEPRLAPELSHDQPALSLDTGSTFICSRKPWESQICHCSAIFSFST